jgi:hypothetical protein
MFSVENVGIDLKGTDTAASLALTLNQLLTSTVASADNTIADIPLFTRFPPA